MMNMMLKGVCVLLGALVIAGAQSVHAEEVGSCAASAL